MPDTLFASEPPAWYALAAGAVAALVVFGGWELARLLARLRSRPRGAPRRGTPLAGEARSLAVSRN